MRPPKPVPVSRVQVLLGQNTTWTRDLRHVKAVIPRAWHKERTVFKQPKFKDTKPKDRIKWWNIVPGDEVRLRGDPQELIHEVRRINRYTNRVYLRIQNVRRVIHLHQTVVTQLESRTMPSLMPCLK